MQRLIRTPDEQIDQAAAPGSDPAAVGSDGVRQQARGLADHARAAIARALATDSKTFVLNARQSGGE